MLIVVKLMGKHRGRPSSSDAALDGQYHRIHSMLVHLEAQARLPAADAMRFGDRIASYLIVQSGGATASPAFW